MTDKSARRRALPLAVFPLTAIVLSVGLVVDDAMSFATVVSQYLNSLEYRADFVVNAEAALERIRRARPRQVIYVSCHPATLARDLAATAVPGGGQARLSFVAPSTGTYYLAAALAPRVRTRLAYTLSVSAGNGP